VSRWSHRGRGERLQRLPKLRHPLKALGRQSCERLLEDGAGDRGHVADTLTRERGIAAEKVVQHGPDAEDIVPHVRQAPRQTLRTRVGGAPRVEVGLVLQVGVRIEADELDL
jgi:hypothetical protein